MYQLIFSIIIIFIILYWFIISLKYLAYYFIMYFSRLFIICISMKTNNPKDFSSDFMLLCEFIDFENEYIVFFVDIFN